MPGETGGVLLATCAERPDLTPADALLREALERRGMAVRAEPWDRVDPADEPAETICLRSTWDYHERWPEFAAWLDRCEVAGRRLVNPLPTVRWNADKIYLRALAEAGVALPPTWWLPPGASVDAATLTEAFDALQVREAVLKPRVSAGAYGTERLQRGSAPAAEARAAIAAVGGMLQAFVPEIETAGELSLVFLGDKYSHAVRKMTAPGDFRVQASHGGTAEPFTAPTSTVSAAAAMLAVVPCPWTYARVDIVEASGGPLLMEIELVEPALFLTAAAAERLADLLVSAHQRA